MYNWVRYSRRVAAAGRRNFPAHVSSGKAGRKVDPTVTMEVKGSGLDEWDWRWCFVPGRVVVFIVLVETKKIRHGINLLFGRAG